MWYELTEKIQIFNSPTKDGLKIIAEDYWKIWNFPNCVGAIDGKHIRSFALGKSGSLIFFNRSLAIVDANCKFIFVDIGSYGKESDSGIFNKCGISEVTRTGFRLDRHMMRPYSKKESRKDYQKTVFNYRLSRARRTTENSFGLLSQVFRRFVDYLVLSACCLHNIFRDRYLENTSYHYYNFDHNEPQPSTNMTSLAKTGGFANIEGFCVRDELKNSQGAIPWQHHQVQQNGSL
ncbi:protein ANTAGONIST OF LIKE HETEROCHROMATIN PROTEIN 1-like [Aphis craccivora]|uniref:Protein ANTAGONIST OF LIKE HETEROCHROMATIN PROTEIN 1-like n=1 Tax=Aphis craccivora TaxID=307492 RepID=A0A6G0VP48_APHCR|nr:protein ANTAGONIST OF LIKE HETEROCHROMATIN PROTEIN 1-like [Aphis craccivora]